MLANVVQTFRMDEDLREPPANPPLWWKMKKSGARAVDILEKFHVRRPIVEVEAIAHALGVPVVHVANPGWSGAVKSEGTKAVIWLDQAESEERKRFTIAHELGHLLLHPPGMEFRDSSFGGDQLEREANEFAADILMPLWMLEPIAVKLGSSTKQLAKTFGVSSAAMSVRLAKLAGVG